MDLKKTLDDAKITNQDAALRQASGRAFYNTSPFTLRDLGARAKAQTLKAATTGRKSLSTYLARK